MKHFTLLLLGAVTLFSATAQEARQLGRPLPDTLVQKMRTPTQAAPAVLRERVYEPNMGPWETDYIGPNATTPIPSLPYYAPVTASADTIEFARFIPQNYRHYMMERIAAYPWFAAGCMTTYPFRSLQSIRGEGADVSVLCRPYTFEKGKTYNVRAYVCSRAATEPYRFDIIAAKEQTRQAITLVQSFTGDNYQDYVPVEARFIPEETGTYYLGWRWSTPSWYAPLGPEWSSSCRINSFVIEVAPQQATAIPAEVPQNFSFTFDFLSAEGNPLISFNAPANDIHGTPLTDIVDITLKNVTTGTTIKSWSYPEPGALLEVEDPSPVRGNINIYSIETIGPDGTPGVTGSFLGAMLNDRPSPIEKVHQERPAPTVAELQIKLERWQTGRMGRAIHQPWTIYRFAQDSKRDLFGQMIEGVLDEDIDLSDTFSLYFQPQYSYAMTTDRLYINMDFFYYHVNAYNGVGEMYEASNTFSTEDSWGGGFEDFDCLALGEAYTEYPVHETFQQGYINLGQAYGSNLSIESSWQGVRPYNDGFGMFLKGQPKHDDTVQPDIASFSAFNFDKMGDPEFVVWAYVSDPSVKVTFMAQPMQFGTYSFYDFATHETTDHVPFLEIPYEEGGAAVLREYRGSLREAGVEGDHILRIIFDNEGTRSGDDIFFVVDNFYVEDKNPYRFEPPTDLVITPGNGYTLTWQAPANPDTRMAAPTYTIH